MKDQAGTRLFLGVDGGQSSTTALVGDEHSRVLGMGRAGPCNHLRAYEGPEKFVRALSGSVEAALRDAGASAPTAEVRFQAACFGFSGGPSDKDTLTRQIVRAEKYHMTHDAEIALAGATGGEPGVIVIAGTGSIAFGRNLAGRTARAGGWGFIFGDEGGAFDLVRQALRAALRHEEGWGPKTILREALLQAAGDAAVSSVNDLLHRFYTVEYPRDRVAALAKLVDAAAGDGDAVARDIMTAAAQTLALLAGAVRGQLFEPGEVARVSYAGGVFQSRSLLERFRMLVELEDANRFGPPAYGPAVGALLEAYRIGGVTCKLGDIPANMSI